MGELVAVLGDQNSHAGGNLNASNNPSKVFVQGKLLVMKDSTAQIDGLAHIPASVNAATASSKVFACGIPVHRNNDTRYCGASTIVSNQSKVYAG